MWRHLHHCGSTCGRLLLDAGGGVLLLRVVTLWSNVYHCSLHFTLFHLTSPYSHTLQLVFTIVTQITTIMITPLPHCRHWHRFPPRHRHYITSFCWSHLIHRAAHPPQTLTISPSPIFTTTQILTLFHFQWFSLVFCTFSHHFMTFPSNKEI